MSRAYAIAIDGPVAAGKTTVGRLLAESLGALFFDSGVVYRASALQALRSAVDPNDDAKVADTVAAMDLQLENTASGTRLLVDGVDVTDELRTPEVDRALPPISANQRVRRELLGIQRSAVAGHSAVVVGRDIGTVILPDADLKIYLDSASDERARRRYEELRGRGVEISHETVYRDLLERDRRDISREAAPLQIADGAVVVDATGKSVDEVVEQILKVVQERRIVCPQSSE